MSNMTETQQEMRAAASVGGIAAGNICKAKAAAAKLKHRAMISAMPQYQAGAEFTRADVIAETGLCESVVNGALRDMVDEHKLNTRIIDENGTLAFKRVPAQIHWKAPTADLSFTPKYY